MDKLFHFLFNLLITLILGVILGILGLFGLDFWNKRKGAQVPPRNADGTGPWHKTKETIIQMEKVERPKNHWKDEPLTLLKRVSSAGVELFTKR